MALRVVLLLLLLGGLGCSHGPFRPVGGEDFATEHLDQIQDGTTTEEVLRPLGEPLDPADW